MGVAVGPKEKNRAPVSLGRTDAAMASISAGAWRMRGLTIRPAFDRAASRSIDDGEVTHAQSR